MDLVRVSDVRLEDVAALLSRFGLRFRLEAGPSITGSYWGEPEAGLSGDVLHARDDTPVHSVLHEASHFVCMSSDRRSRLERDAGGDDLEESAVCYLQVLLADHLPGMSRERLFRDMDLWGYSFRLGSTRAWFEEDSGDARRWLEERGLVDGSGAPSFRLRE
jgi:hypothetical protein